MAELIRREFAARPEHEKPQILIVAHDLSWPAETAPQSLTSRAHRSTAPAAQPPSPPRRHPRTPARQVRLCSKKPLASHRPTRAPRRRARRTRRSSRPASSAPRRQCRRCHSARRRRSPKLRPPPLHSPPPTPRRRAEEAAQGVFSPRPFAAGTLPPLTAAPSSAAPTETPQTGAPSRSFTAPPSSAARYRDAADRRLFVRARALTAPSYRRLLATPLTRRLPLPTGLDTSSEPRAARTQAPPHVPAAAPERETRRRDRFVRREPDAPRLPREDRRRAAQPLQRIRIRRDSRRREPATCARYRGERTGRRDVYE